MVGCDLFTPNRPPEITSEAVTTATVGVAYTYDVDATDPNAGDVLTYSLTTEPSGMLIDEDNGVITWTPDTAGDFPVTVEVSDEGGLSDTQDFTITVSVAELIGIEVVPELMNLSVRGSEAIESVTAHYDDGSTAVIALGDCTYLSSDEAVATVLVGVVSALTPGTATITVTYADMTDTLEVTVNSILLTSIVVLPEEMNLFLGGINHGILPGVKIESVTAHYSDGSTASIALGDCTYDSSAIEVATVATGKVTAVAYGEATITVTYMEEEITKAVHIEETDTIAVKVIDKVHNIDANRYYPTITLAIDDAIDGDTIEVAAGTYLESEMHIDKSLTIQGAGRSDTIVDVDGKTEGFYIDTDNVTIKDLTVKNAGLDNIVFSFVTVSNATIDNIASLDSEFAGLKVHNSTITNLVINNCLFSGNATHGMRVSETGGGVDGMTITNSHFDGNNGTGVSFYGSVTDALIENSTFNDNLFNAGEENLGNGIYVERLSGTTFTNVTANNNHLAGCNINLYDACENLVFNDCTFMGNGITEDKAGLIIMGRNDKNPLASLTGVDINGGTFSGNGIGISVGNNVTDIEIHNANIFGNYHTGWKINAGVISWSWPETIIAPSIDATYNWWGDASGPTHPSTTGIGDVVSDNVVFVPFSTEEN